MVRIVSMMRTAGDQHGGGSFRILVVGFSLVDVYDVWIHHIRNYIINPGHSNLEGSARRPLMRPGF